MFPSYLLNQLYFKNSLKNTPNGFEFSIKNIVDSGTLVGIGPVTMDGKTYDAAALTILMGSQERSASEVSHAAPLSVYMGSVLRILVSGESLAPGEHQGNVIADTREMGRIRFEFKELLT